MTDSETEPIYTADVVALTPGGDVLLVERSRPPFEGAWALPGGHVGAKEAPFVAAARQLAEETGVQVSVGSLHQIGVWDQVGRDPRGAYVTFAYMVIVPDGTVAVARDDARTACWWPVKNLPENLAFDHADIIGAAVTPNS
ncbi:MULTISPECIES: NUDIX hydrolase [unclassified Streptomyces]|uniref:NUDIX domain-containing protein n=1 Tax=unclassified Streptomyces TaxID=2593676 RepID=UPI001BE6625D|nr:MULTISPECIES: NUDIX hydrolase [unclassified Streptomyces]MBT2406888.1 NUDIX hydrolase [Streptomyces sp. ISL-21]MBT2613077.1 NUDIX hydrolase [Streptomyces sp. ISL-87]